MDAPAALLSQIEDSLDRFDVDAVMGGDRLRCSQLARGLASRLTAISATLLARADAASDSLRQSGTPTTSWLATQATMSKREAAGMLHQARELHQHPEVGRAAVDGAISISQARTISKVLYGLPELSDEEASQAAQLLVSLADRQDCDQLAKSVPAVLAAVAADLTWATFRGFAG